VSLAVLRKENTSSAFLKSLWTQARQARAKQSRPCPNCARRMVKAGFPRIVDKPLVLDVCCRCQFVWFDLGEYGGVPRTVDTTAQAPKAPRRVSSEKMRALVSASRETASGGARTVVVSSFRETVRGAMETEEGESVWDYLPAVFGLPVESGAPRVMSRPLVTWGLTALMAFVTLYLVSRGASGGAIQRWGFVPAEWARHMGLTLVSSFFLHAGLLHLAGNAYFFLLFGDNVEDHLGKVKFLILLAAAHVAGMALHAMHGPYSDIPCVGASAGISGVIAYYAVAFPQVRIKLLFWIVIVPKWVRIPAWLALLLYVAMQLFGALQQMMGFTNVSYLAHLGGLSVGILAGFWAQLSRDEHKP
jgi:membrane associated rhomboid family serine protease